MTLEAGQHFQTLLQLIDGIVWEADTQTKRNTFVSDKLQQVLGYTPQEWQVPAFWDDCLHPEDRERVMREGETLLLRGEPYQLEYRMLTKDGRVVWLRDLITPIRQDGRLVKLGGVMLDITRQREQEQQMRDLQQRLQHVFAASPVGIALAGLYDGRVADTNPAFLNIIGFDRDAVIGSDNATLDLWVHRAHRAEITRALETLGTVHQFESQLRHRTGGVRDVLLSCERLDLHGADGQPLVLFLTQDITERKRLDVALEASEARFRALAQHSSDIITIQDPQGTILYASPSMASILGYPEAEVLGQVSLKFMHPDEHAELIAAFTGVLQAGPGGTVRRVNRFCTQRGAWRWLEWVATNHLSDPHIRGIVMNARDVTERQQAVAAVEASEARFRALVQHSTDLVDVLDRRGTILYMSPSCATILGYDPDGMVGCNSTDFMHPDDLAAAMAAYGAVVYGGPGTIVHHTNRFRTQDGAWRWLEWSATNRLDDPNIGGIVMNARDVTERRHAEAALEASEARFRALVQRSTDIITVLDRAGRLRYASPSMTTLLGYVVDDVLGYLSLDYIHPDERASVQDTYAGVVYGGPGTTRQLVSRFRTQDGAWRWLEWVATNRLDDPNIRGIVMNARDVTERRRAEAALRDSQDRLLATEKLASLGRLTAGLAHEINTPLAAAMNYLHEAQRLAQEYHESIGAHGVTEDDHREIAQELSAALRGAAGTTARIGEFIRRMRSHTRDVNSGAVEFDPARLAGETLAMLAHQARAAGIELQLDAAHTPLVVRGEPGRFTQIVTNLVVNAIHACEGGAGSRVSVTLARVDGRPALQVSDDGSGIPADVLPRIFEPMFTTKDTGKGTGLGLSILHDIVTGHFHGDIQVRTRVGEGTTFTVRFA